LYNVLKKFSRYNRGGKKGGSFGGSKALKKTPISVAEEYRVNIEDVSRKGNAGIAKIGGFVIFVNDTKPGDKVTIKITKVAEGYATAKVMNRMMRNEKEVAIEHKPESTYSSADERGGQMQN
jgi:predicted RNA-binding protein with TRAM domain